MKKKISVRRWFGRSHQATAYGQGPRQSSMGLFFFRGPDPRHAIKKRSGPVARPIGDKASDASLLLNDTKVSWYRLSPTWRLGLVSHGLLGFLIF